MFVPRSKLHSIINEGVNGVTDKRIMALKFNDYRILALNILRLAIFLG